MIIERLMHKLLDDHDKTQERLASLANTLGDQHEHTSYVRGQSDKTMEIYRYIMEVIEEEDKNNQSNKKNSFIKKIFS